MEDQKNTGYLVLSRRQNEGLTITIPASSEDTVIHTKVSSIRGKQARLAIQAPSGVTVVRDEIKEQVA
ncbi:carbon storage regulator [Marinomonas transparens]|uniref:Carbon storage regulator n=1 Tax=Marinomonas transparens TaxID=2795388 RepID=A0A934JZ97_9GAMM|nr:carbon storage regulator [Marinomonas transparens]MBJ7539854.1 carbon storage regulator [Marinomonas transparens]